MAKERVVIINPVTSSLNAVYTYVAGVVWWGAGPGQVHAEKVEA
jgi:hypothetical protein